MRALRIRPRRACGAGTSHTNFCDGAEAPEAIRERPSPRTTHAFSGRGYYERSDPHPAGDGWRTRRKRRGIPEPHEFVRKARGNLNQNAWDYIVGAAETETTM